MINTRPHKITVALLTALVVLLTPVSRAAAAQSTSYWLASSTGQVFAYGHAKLYGSEAGQRFRGRMLGIKGTSNGRGYWLVTTKTHYSFGDARDQRYRSGGLKRYTGHLHPKGIKGRIVGYAPARLATNNSNRGGGGGGGGGTHTTPTGTTTTPTSTVTCTGAAIQTAALNSATAGQPFSETLSAGGITGGSWVWNVTSGNLPTGLSLSSTGTLAGTPAQSAAGTQSTITVQAVNSQCPNSPATKAFTLSVPVAPMSITTSSLPAGTYGQAYSTTALQVTGGQPGNYQWSASGPSWSSTGLSLSNTGVLSGTVQNVGTYNVTFTVTDSTGATPAVSVTLPITLSYPPLQITSPTSLADGQATVAYSSVTFSATGGTPMSEPPQYRAGDYTWAAAGLPSGMSMSVSGVLSGTPATQGSYTVAVTLTDALNTSNHITQDFTLNVAYPPLQFTTSTLTAIQGQAYSGQVVAHGGEAPYTQYRLAGTLPSGMSFNNGTLTVAATVPSGDYQFTLGVTDSQASPATATETFNMWVAPSQTTPDLTVGSSTNGTIWAGYVEQAPSAFTSVSGTLTVPTVHDTPANSVTPWVGIDGYGTNNLIQAGISATGGNGTTTYQAWWETCASIGSPQNLPPQDQFEASPGDTVNVNIWQLSSGTWEITLNDITSGQGFAAQVSYTGADTTAEWIVETPSGSAATGYASTSTFSNLEASQAGSGMLELTTTGATPTTLTSSGFSISDYN